MDPAIRAVPDVDAQAPPSLGFRGQVASQAALCLVMDFGDSSGVPVAICNVTGGAAVTAYHQFGKGRVLGVRSEPRRGVQVWRDPRDGAGHTGAERRPHSFLAPPAPPPPPGPPCVRVLMTKAQEPALGPLPYTVPH